MVSYKETLESGHVAVLALPGNEDTAGGHITNVETADRRKWTQFCIFGCQQITILQTLWSRAAGTNIRARPSSIDPFSILRQPQLLMEGVTRTNKGVA